jgi:hypothetical protein
VASTYPLTNLAPAKFLQQLDAIESGVWGTPCAVTLEDGSCHDVCLAWENQRYSDKGTWLNPNRVSEVRQCQWRLPAKFARIIHDAGESGMGYHIYVVELSDGTNFVHLAGNLIIDLLNFPFGYGPKDVVNVLPHQGRERTERNKYRQVAEYCSLEFARDVPRP